MGRKRRAEGDAPPADPDATPAPVARRRRRIWGGIWAAVVVIVAAGVLLVTVLPFRAWLDQREDIATSEAKLARLTEENERLGARIDALGTSEEIERVAREQYQLARPGERVYAVLPAPGPAGLTDGWPLGLLQHLLEVRAAAPVPAEPTG